MGYVLVLSTEGPEPPLAPIVIGRTPGPNKPVTRRGVNLICPAALLDAAHRAALGTRRRSRPFLRCGLALLAVATGDAAAQPAADAESPAAPTLLTQHGLARARKDSTLRHGIASPIPAAQRPSFAGLTYFTVDPRYRLAGTMQVYGRQRRIEIPTTGDTPVEVERFGRFTSSFDGIPFSLEIYRSVEADQLSVFFTDATNGEQTYGGGRYAPVQDLENGRYVIDFNEAYNPYCAYNHDYVCPLPPAQNRLPFSVLAGEMDYGPHLAPR